MSHAKVILFGEHSVVYGNKAIVLPFKTLKTNVELCKEIIEEKEHTKFIKKLIEDKYIVDNYYISISSDIPISRGLGSSAALANAIAYEYNKKYNDIDIENIVKDSEIKAHGNPSGIDEYITRYDNPIIFQKNNEILDIKFKMNAYLVIIDSGIESDTKLAVNLVSNGNNKVNIQKISDITEYAISNINNKYIIGKLFNESQKILKNMKLSNDKIDKLIKISNYYSLGSKITGAGLGGCIITLIENKKKLNKLIKKLNKKGIKNIWIMEV